MSKLTKALELARKGFPVFPLVADTKNPAIKNFPNRATTNEEVIRAWWTDPVLDLEKDHNIGISTNSFVVVDVDDKNGKDGSGTLLELELEGFEFPPTLTFITPTGGRHLVYSTPAPRKQGVNVLGNGLDTRCFGGYIVAPGSTLGEEEYKVLEDRAIAEVPTWLFEKLGAPLEKQAKVLSSEVNVNEAVAIERAIYYLEHEAPESIKGQGGDQTAYKVACKVKDFGVSEQTALDLMMTYWFEGSGWSAEKLSAKIAHAYKYGVNSIGADAPEMQFTPLAPESAEEHYLKKINKDHALVLMEGTYFVINETVDEKGRAKRVFLSEQAFKRKFSAYTVQGKSTFATEWLDWKNRREYQGICFAPGRDAKNNYYNLWRGFTTSPLPYEQASEEAKKGFDAFISHARDNVCQGNEFLFKWLMGYFAHLIQKPYERPLVTLVFRGTKGVGKNALIDRIGKLISGHYIVAHNRRYLTSNFNGHMDSCLVLVLDEAFWSGDKDAEGQLKGITTAPEIMIERKGKEPYMVDNLVRLVIIGNEDWLVPASTDERRYAVLDIGEGKKQQKKFFEDMRINLDDKGGNAVLLHYLMSFDLSGVDVNEAPKTEGLLDQKINSLEPLANWWFNSLHEGKLLDSIYGDEWPEHVSMTALLEAFAYSARQRNIRSRLPDVRIFAKEILSFCPSAQKRRVTEEGSRSWKYKIPSLEEARNEWNKFIGQGVTWPKGE